MGRLCYSNKTDDVHLVFPLIKGKGGWVGCAHAQTEFLIPNKISRKEMAGSGEGDNSLYPIAVLIDELRNDDVQVLQSFLCNF